MVHEWNGHVEMFSRPQVIENCYKKESLGQSLYSLRRRRIRLPI